MSAQLERYFPSTERIQDGFESLGDFGDEGILGTLCCESDYVACSRRGLRGGTPPTPP